MIESFDAITNYCQKHNKSISIRNHAVCTFLSVLKEASSSSENQTPMRISTTKAALLTEESIAGYVSRAESVLEEYNSALIEPYLKVTDNSFFSNVFSSVVGSFIYTLLIILAFYFGKEQIHTWLQSF